MKSYSFPGGLSLRVNRPFKSKQRDPSPEIALILIDPSSYNLTGLSNDPHDHAFTYTCPCSRSLLSMLSPHTKYLAVWLQCGKIGSRIVKPTVGLFYISLCAECNKLSYMTHAETILQHTDTQRVIITIYFDRKNKVILSTYCSSIQRRELM